MSAAPELVGYPLTDRAMQYAERVVAGEIVACEYIKLACARQLDDLEHGAERRLYWDAAASERFLRFAHLCPHVKGPLAGKPIELDEWALFWHACLYGWKRYTDEAGAQFGADPDDPATWPRRFTQAYVEVARKNAKSTIAAIDGLYLTGADGEGGAEVYSAATKHDQAKIVWQIAARMVEMSPLLRRVLEAGAKAIYQSKTGSTFQPLAADWKTLDGLNISGVIVDELHAHKNRDVLEILESGIGSRFQPLILMITTAGVDRAGIAYEKRGYVIKVLQGLIVDDTIFGLVYTQDESDYSGAGGTHVEELFGNEAVWRKSNPSLGVSVSLENMRQQVREALETPAKRSQVLRKKFNIWWGAASAWMDLRRWHACKPLASLEELAGRRCFGGLDLASKVDLAAYVLLFLDDETGAIDVLPRFYLPRDALIEKAKFLGTLFDTWGELGLLTLTPGDCLDESVIEDDIREDMQRFQIEEFGYDPWHCHRLALNMLEEGAPMIEVRQTTKNLSEAMKTVDVWVRRQQLRHGDHAILDWCISNTVAEEDRRGNIAPTKESPENRIDGAVALIIAAARLLLHVEPEPSVYEERGIL